MKVLLINGSPHEKGCTYTALSLIAGELKAQGIEPALLHVGGQPVGGCIGCGGCRSGGGCVFGGVVNEAIEKAKPAAGFVFGSPVHYASASGNMTSFMDRLSSAGGKYLAYKPAAICCSARRAGTTSTLDQLVKYPQFFHMPLVNGSYWAMVHGSNPEQVLQAAEGCAVCVNYRERQDCAMSLVAEISAAGGRAMAVQADVAKRAEVNAMVAQCERERGKGTLRVNNAGVAGQELFQDVTDEMWERYFGANLNGARNTIQAVLPNMLLEKSGCIVIISSIRGQLGASCEATYSCTKHALIGLTRSLARELAPSGIRVNCVAPGVIETDMVRVQGEETIRDLVEQTPLGRLGRPEDIAEAVVYLASDKASFVTGQVLAVDGAFVL